MFDLLEEQYTTQEHEADQIPEEKSARAVNSGSAALFSMPEKFIQKENAGKKKSHPMIMILVFFIVMLGIGSLGLAFAIQSKNARLAAEEKARQEAASAAALRARRAGNQAMSTSDENIPFKFTEPQTATSTESVAPSLTSTTESLLISDATSTESAISSTTSSQEEVVLTFGQDFDKDKLTDTEERVYATDPKKPDTDADGLLDGAEIKNLSDPTKGEQVALKDSGLVNMYTNQTFQYAFLYPKSDEWAVAPVDQSQKEVLVSAVSGEYVSIRVEDNPQKLPIVDWYTMVYAAGKQPEKIQSTSFESWNVLMRQDGLVYYLTRKDEKNETLTGNIYILAYAPNARKELHYLTTFQMIAKSFMPIEVSITIPQ